ncbi:MAG: cupin domain-containing protein [Gemmatimonadota bacterium]|nr:cupin domain-containing protein [Gemmatimonadota bacterium]
MTPFHLTPAQGLARMPGPYHDQYDVVLRHGTLDVGLYAPRGADPQTPHTRDEVYVVISGSGWFQNGEDRVAFGPGDVLFVPAHREHRFEEFSDDLALWVFFYGPEGGEVAQPH